MDIVTTFIPIREGDSVLGTDGEPHMLTVHVRPAFDQAFRNPYDACDVLFEDHQGDRRAFSTERAREVLATIRRDQPRIWAEIEAAAHSPLAA